MSNKTDKLKLTGGMREIPLKESDSEPLTPAAICGQCGKLWSVCKGSCQADASSQTNNTSPGETFFPYANVKSDQLVSDIAHFMHEIERAKVKVDAMRFELRRRPNLTATQGQIAHGNLCPLCKDWHTRDYNCRGGANV